MIKSTIPRSPQDNATQSYTVNQNHSYYVVLLIIIQFFLVILVLQMSPELMDSSVPILVERIFAAQRELVRSSCGYDMHYYS